MKPGDKFRVSPGFDALDKAASGNAQLGAHLWVLVVTYGLTDQEAAHAGEGIDVHMDPEHLLAVTDIGCYICEQLHADISGQKCKGNPVRYGPNAEPIYADGSTG